MTSDRGHEEAGHAPQQIPAGSGLARQGDGGDTPIDTCLAALIFQWKMDMAEWSSADWVEGPYPFPYADGELTREERLTYFAPHTAAALYGQSGHSVRVHKEVDTGLAPAHGFRPICVEVLALDFWSQDTNCLVVVHGDVVGGDEVRSLSKLASPDDTLRAWFEDQVVGTGALLPATEPRATTVVFAIPRTATWPAVFSDHEHWPADIQWLRLLASCTTPERYTPHKQDLREYESWTYSLSSDWRALALPDGVAFLALRPDEGEGDYFRWGEVYVRSLYLDAILLGVAQKLLLRELLSEVADLEDPLEHPSKFRQIERRITRFRNIYWWQVVTPNGHANRLLELYAKQNRLSAMAKHAIDETARFSEQIETRAAQRSNTALAVLTVVGLPLGAAIAVAQTLQYQPAWAWLGVFVVVGALISLVLWRVGVRKGLIESLRRESLPRDGLQLPATRQSAGQNPPTAELD